jgi:peptidoglycan hydrolase-like protein with peptidoglycan-binding domain
MVIRSCGERGEQIVTTSQNGWPASRDKVALGIDNVKLPGTDVDFPQGIKSGDVAVVLLYVAAQFHHTVEPLADGTCWGYFYKVIEGSSTISNHASGTAIDLNADQHPMGKSGTFSSAQVKRIQEILAFCGGVVRWGGNYTGRKDEMHFEINASAAAVSRLAAKIRVAGGAPVTPPPPPSNTNIVKKGDKGSEVVHIQQFLHDTFPAYKDSVSVKPGQLITVDGDFGDQTEAWVKEFQTRTNIDVDGIVGPQTFAEMRKYGYKY